MNKNVWLSSGEIDLLARDGTGQIVMVEVRGRLSKSHRPIEMLTAAKRNRLRRLARSLSKITGSAVRIEFLEILGPVRWHTRWTARFGIFNYGLEWRWYRIE